MTFADEARAAAAAEERGPITLEVLNVHRHDGEAHVTVALSYELWLQLCAQYGTDKGIQPEDVDTEADLCTLIGNGYAQALQKGIDAYLFED